MKACIQVESYETSIWGGFQQTAHQETTHWVEEGACIETVVLGVPYRFEIAAVHPESLEMRIQPALVLFSESPQRSVGSLTLDVGETAALQTPSFDAWGHWTVSLERIL